MKTSTLILAVAVGLVAGGCSSPNTPSGMPALVAAPDRGADHGGARPGREADAADAPAAEKAPVARAAAELRLGGFALRLTNCTLIATRGAARFEHRFDFPGQCRFSVDHTAATRVVETRAGSVVVVEASRAEEGRWCDTRLRAVVVDGDRIALSADTQKIKMCGPQTWDTLVYHAFASETVALESAAP